MGPNVDVGVTRQAAAIAEPLPGEAPAIAPADDGGFHVADVCVMINLADVGVMRSRAFA